MAGTPLYDLGPAGHILLIAGLPVAAFLLWLRWHRRHEAVSTRLQALTVLTLFLCFDLVVFGAFTRLTDSGLGCPDWPGCYGSASPLGAGDEIHAAQADLPGGPVTHGKAWVEMIHRYLATGVGGLILALAVAAWILGWRRPTQAADGAAVTVSPLWATLTLLWVCVQGAFGALTVTMKLYPAVVTAHLLGGLGLLGLLAMQVQRQRPAERLVLPRSLRLAAWGVLGIVVLQMALGGWVSTNYAVLACSDFPTCQGQWWPTMDFDHGFALRRELGRGHDGDWLPFPALTAIHFVHRAFALVALAALAGLAWRLARLGSPGDGGRAGRYAMALALAAAWQLLSGLSNVVLGWPMLAALAHTAGAAVLIVVLARLLTAAQMGARTSWPAGGPSAQAKAGRGGAAGSTGRWHHV